MGLQLQLGEVTCTPSSPIPEETSQSSIPVLKQLYSRIEERNKRIKESVESKLETQSISEYHTRLLSAMDLERNQLKLSFSHPSALTISSSAGFKTVNLTVDAREIPLLDKINLHRQTRELIYSDLSKKSTAASKVEALLGKVVNQLKLEKENSRTLFTQNEELKKLIVKIRVNPKDRTVV